MKPSSCGYVNFIYDYKLHRLHREVLRLKLGRPIGEGMQAAHLCHNKACCNEDHLVEATQSENVGHSLKDGLWPVGERKPNAKLTEDDVREIRRRRDAGETCVAIAKDFGVAFSLVHRIGWRTQWRHVS